MRRALFRLFFLGALAASVCVAFVSVLIARQAGRDEARPADLIVVLGAAEYRGKPSPVFRARLDHGLALYRRGLASRLLTTGGAGGDPDYTEGGVGRDYLINQGVPAEAIIVEPEGESTAHSIAATGEIMTRMGLKSCIVVSDGYHLYRAKRMLESRGLLVYGSPRPSSSRGEPWLQYAREAVGYLLWLAGLQ